HQRPAAARPPGRPGRRARGGAGRGRAGGRGGPAPDHHRPGPAGRSGGHGPPVRAEAPVSFLYPVLLVVAAGGPAAAVAAYVWLQRRRAAALAAAGLGTLPGGPRRGALRRPLPYALLLPAPPLLLGGL